MAEETFLLVWKLEKMNEKGQGGHLCALPLRKPKGVSLEKEWDTRGKINLGGRVGEGARHSKVQRIPARRHH